MIEQYVLFTYIGVFNSIALVSNAKYTWITAFIVIVLIIGLYFSIGISPDFTNEIVHQSKTASRALWLCLAVLLMTTLGVEFKRIYGALGDKISE